MIGFGAERVLIDGSIDRRAGSSPAVADGLVIATGAVLSEDIEEVVTTTKDAVDLVRLPTFDAAPAASSAGEEQVTLERQIVLNAEPAEIATLLREHARASTFHVEGALSESFLKGLLTARTQRAGRTLRIVASDPTKVFLTHHGPNWYRRQGIEIEVRETIDLKAITVNPTAPQAHRFDSQHLRELIETAVGDVPVLDVLDPSYLALAK
jgi:hypothetical protein